MDQDDTLGHEGLAWGSEKPKDAYRLDTSGISGPLEKAVGPSGETINEAFIPSEAPQDIDECGLHAKDGVYGYYQGKLAYVDVHLRGNWHDAAATLDDKYGTYDEVTQQSYGDGKQPVLGSHWNYKGGMWKRQEPTPVFIF